MKKRKQLETYVKGHLDPDRLSTRWSIQSIIEPKFRGPGGINCRSRLEAPNAVNREIDRIIADRFTGTTGPDPQTQGSHKEFIK